MSPSSIEQKVDSSTQTKTRRKLATSSVVMGCFLHACYVMAAEPQAVLMTAAYHASSILLASDVIVMSLAQLIEYEEAKEQESFRVE